MTILQRTIKLVLATTIAIAVANYFGLAYATSAGVIAILSVLDSRRSTIKIALQRTLTALLGMSLAIILFNLFGYNLAVIAVFVACFVPIAYYWRLEVGIAPITVLVFHLYVDQSTAWPLILNELGLLFIGMTSALILNVYMPSKAKEISYYQDQVEESLREVLVRLSYLLKTGDGANDGQLIAILENHLQKAIVLVELETNNDLWQTKNYHLHYFEMRQRQSKILIGMAESIKKLQAKSEESLLLAKLFEDTALQLSHENPGTQLINDIQSSLQDFRERPLPQTRHEFETRALLFQLLGDLERFILEKVDFYGTFQDRY